MRSTNPRRLHIMAVEEAQTLDDPYYPKPGTAGAGGSGGTLYGATSTEADSLFDDGDADVLIHEIRVDKEVAGQLTLRAGSTSPGDIVTVMTSSTSADAAIRTPFVLPGGFHININTVGMNFTVVYEVIPKASA